MKLKLVALAALLALTGCASRQMTSRDYAIMREQIRSDPEMRKAHLDACIKAWSRANRTSLAKLARTSEAKAPQVACQRMVRAVAAGRMTRDEFNAGSLTPTLTAIIRG